MAHEVETMFYAGAVPWHGLGTRVEGLLNSSDAIQAAGLDWEVEKRPLFTQDENENHIPVPDKYAVVRKTDNQVLGVVGGRYHPIQNREAFEFFDEVVGEKLAIYEVAGSLKKGRVIWILANLQGRIDVVGNDPIDKYLLLFNSHDGSKALGVMFTPIRVVCNNTLNCALRRTKHVYYIRHTPNYRDRVREAQEALRLADNYYNTLSEYMKAFASKPVTVEITRNYVEKLLPLPKSKREKIVERHKEYRQTLMQLIETGRGTDIKGVRGTV